MPSTAGAAIDPSSLAPHTGGRGWKRLPRPEIKKGFIARMLRRRTEGAFTADMNKPSKPRLIGAQDPGDKAVVAHEEWRFDGKPENRFISNALQDVEMNVDMIQARLEREDKLAKAGGLSQIIAMGSLDFSGDKSVMAIEAAQRDAELADRVFAAEKAALAAVSAGNFEKLEACVDDDKINVNCIDDHGNTLLILAAQQGNKRMVKFLLRRGANMNLQNFAGNSPLHYAYAYNHEELGQYLESKGADNSLLNASGLTCYEGLRKEDVDAI
jgi:hypothetical protein